MNLAQPRQSTSLQTKRVLVLGATGMLGHKLAQILPTAKCSVIAAIQSGSMPEIPALQIALNHSDRVLAKVDAADDKALLEAVELAAPDVVINAVGLIKQLDSSKNPISSIAINSLLPHRLAAICVPRGIRLIHFSTDCVFSGKKGPYSEDSVPDAQDLYGRSKLLGEVNQDKCLTIRTSIIGRELRRRSSLLEWFLSQRGEQVAGYTRALYTGLTTNEMAKLVGTLIENHPDMDGIWHVASDPISKYELLQLINREFDLGIKLARDENFFCDRRLNGNKFREKTGYVAPTWESMIAELRSDSTPYDSE